MHNMSLDTDSESGLDWAKSAANRVALEADQCRDAKILTISANDQGRLRPAML
jgi:hypothetical protein